MDNFFQRYKNEAKKYAQKEIAQSNNYLNLKTDEFEIENMISKE